MSYHLTFPPCLYAHPISKHTIFQKTSPSRPKALFQSSFTTLPFCPTQQGSQRDSDYNQGTAAPAMPINVGGLKMELWERGERGLWLHLHTLPCWTGCWGVSAQLVALQQTLQGHIAPARRCLSQACLHKPSLSLKKLSEVSFVVCPNTVKMS